MFVPVLDETLNLATQISASSRLKSSTAPAKPVTQRSKHMIPAVVSDRVSSTTAFTLIAFC